MPACKPLSVYQAKKAWDEALHKARAIDSVGYEIHQMANEAEQRVSEAYGAYIAATVRAKKRR